MEKIKKTKSTNNPTIKEITERPLSFKMLEDMTEEEVDSELEFLNTYLAKVKDKKEQYHEIRLKNKKKETQEKIDFLNNHPDLKDFILRNMEHDRTSCKTNYGNGIYCSDKKNDKTLYYRCKKCAFEELLNWRGPDFDFTFEVKLEQLI